MKRLVRTARALANDASVPAPVRLLLLVGVLPIPGPLDDVAGFVGVALLLIFYRGSLVRAYEEAGLSPLVPHDTWGGWS